MILMNKQELLKQADYTFQRGNRVLAKKYLEDFLIQYPKEESAWVLMARIEEEPGRRIECFERVLKINPNNPEAKIWIARLKNPGKTLPIHKPASKIQIPPPVKNLLRWVGVFTVLAVLFGGTSYAIARKNPDSAVAKYLIIATPTLYAQVPLTGDIASQTRAQMSANYPQYAPIVDALIGYAVNNADNGLEGAPERPGAEILPSDSQGIEAKTVLENALPQPGSLSSATLNEKQLTSWLAMEMKNIPDLPLNGIQVYLRDGKIQIWGMVAGSTDSTSALIVGNLGIDMNKQPVIGIESIQIGTQTIPAALVTQVQAWLNQMLLEEINNQVPGLQVMNINHNNGLITISGMR
jgi:hypothetical protein